MANEVLEKLLSDYEQRRLHSELVLEKRKSELYKSFPRLQEIEDELNSSALLTTKAMLAKNDNSSLVALKSKINKLKKEKISLLTSNGYDEDYLKPIYKCPICKDTGFVNGSLCTCLKQLLIDSYYDSFNMFDLRNNNFSNFNANIFSDDVDLAKYKENISPRKNILNIKEKAIDFVDNFDNPSTKNLLFSGNTGVGKTFLSSCIANEMLLKGKTVLYHTAPILLDSIIDYKLSKNKNDKDNIYKLALEADLLIIDDLGTENLNSMVLNTLSTLLNSRLMKINNRVVKTIISTNLDIKELFSTYEERIGSRFAGYYEIYKFFGDDLRLKQKK